MFVHETLRAVIGRKAAANYGFERRCTRYPKDEALQLVELLSQRLKAFESRSISIPVQFSVRIVNGAHRCFVLGEVLARARIALEEGLAHSRQPFGLAHVRRSRALFRAHPGACLLGSTVDRTCRLCAR